MNAAAGRKWLAEYAPGVPADIDPDQYASLTELLDSHVVQFADLDAFSSFGTRLGYRRFGELARDFAAWLQQDLGLKKGDRIALMLPNLLQYPVAMLGALRAGLVVVNVNPLYTPRELKHQLLDAQAGSIVIVADALPVLQGIAAETPIRNVIVAWPDELLDRHGEHAAPPGCIAFPAALSRGAELRFSPVELRGDDLAFLQYTGGTTGLSKGAMLTHRNLVANTLQSMCNYANELRTGEEIFITALPLYHIFGLTVNLFACIYAGGLNVLIANPRDMTGFVQELSRWKFTRTTGVNTLYNGLLHTPGFDKLDFSTLRTCVAGGMAIQAAVADRWHKLTGCHLLQGYGLSETSPCLTSNPMHVRSFTGSIGVPLPSTWISIRDDAGMELPDGEPGELCARGPQVMPGYWNKPEETRAVMTADGYFRTGDIAVMDSRGYVTIVDRKKDMIIVSGFNVYPNEVEAEVAAMDGVLECACVGAPDAVCGETVVLFLVPKPGAKPGEQEVMDWCRARLTSYKVPKHVRFVDAIPKSNVGKILRRELRALAIT